MADDDLSGEVSVSANLSPTGLEAKAKSRAVIAVDRLVGNVIQLVGAPLERKLDRDRAKGATEVQMIEAAGSMLMQRIHEDPEFAAAAIEQHFKAAVRKQENKAAVVTMALEDLRNEPERDGSGDAQKTDGPDALDDDFLNRFERYAEDATSDQVRERWARVLASEIRKPGTFSSKVLRVIDELDAETAATFETLVKHRIRNIVPKALSGELSFLPAAKLVSAGLLIETTGGQQQLSTIMPLEPPIEGFLVGGSFIVMPATYAAATKRKADDRVVYKTHTQPPRLAFDVYVLTDVGQAVAVILEDNQRSALVRLLDKIAHQVVPDPVLEYDWTSGRFAMRKMWTV